MIWDEHPQEGLIDWNGSSTLSGYERLRDNFFQTHRLTITEGLSFIFSFIGGVGGAGKTGGSGCAGGIYSGG